MPAISNCQNRCLPDETLDWENYRPAVRARIEAAGMTDGECPKCGSPNHVRFQEA